MCQSLLFFGVYFFKTNYNRSAFLMQSSDSVSLIINYLKQVVDVAQ